MILLSSKVQKLFSVKLQSLPSFHRGTSGGIRSHRCQLQCLSRRVFFSLSLPVSCLCLYEHHRFCRCSGVLWKVITLLFFFFFGTLTNQFFFCLLPFIVGSDCLAFTTIVRATAMFNKTLCFLISMQPFKVGSSHFQVKILILLS